MRRYRRTGTIINRKFYQFLIPNVLSVVAVNLTEFVDSILVSHLLGNEAMTMVNMGSPVMLAFAVVYTVLGIGGSVIYAEHAGKQEAEKAARVFSLVATAALGIAVVFLFAGLAFVRPIALAICEDEALMPMFLPYLRAVMISGALIIPLEVLITFLPTFGKPGIGTVVNVIANTANLLMGYVYIRILGTGLKGAAFATLTGYAAGAVFVVVMIALRKLAIPPVRFGLTDLKLPELLYRGAAPALNQLGYCIKIAFCNSIAIRLAGLAGAGIFAICIQTVSMMSIMIVGIIGAMLPIAAMLQGQGDYRGLRMLIKRVMVLQFISNVVLVILLEAFPQILLKLFNVTDPAMMTEAVRGIRIFSIMFIFRGFLVVFMYYFQVISKKLYAVILSVIDGFAGIIPMSLILTSFMGITGLWAAYPVLALLMLIGVAFVNLRIAARSCGKYRGVLLLEREDDIPTYDSTVDLNAHDITENARLIQEFCEENGLEKPISSLVAMASEEMGVYSMEHKEKNFLEELDLLMKIYPEDIVMDVRSIGSPFDILSCPREAYSNVDMLWKIASSVDFGYVTGLNQTRIRISRQNPVTHRSAS